VTRTVIVTALVALVAASRAQAQTPSAEPGRVEIAVASLWLGGASFGERSANETTRDGSTVALFSTTTALDAAAAIELRFGVRLTRRIDVEAVASYARPVLVATVTSDVEAGAGPFIAEERLQQFSFGADLIWRFSPLRAHPRWTPFVLAGAQYLRQLHETNTLLDDGEMYEAGGGVKYAIRSRERGLWKAIGLRGDVRASVRTAGIDVDGRAHVSPAIAASVYALF